MDSGEWGPEELAEELRGLRGTAGNCRRRRERCQGGVATGIPQQENCRMGWSPHKKHLGFGMGHCLRGMDIRMGQGQKEADSFRARAGHSLDALEG